MPAAALLLAWRRRYPLAVLAGVMLAIDSLGFLYGSTQASTSVFIIAIAVYSAAAYGSSVWAGVTITAVGVWIRDAYDPLLTSAGERIWDWIFVGIFYGVGYGTRLAAPAPGARQGASPGIRTQQRRPDRRGSRSRTTADRPRAARHRFALARAAGLPGRCRRAVRRHRAGEGARSVPVDPGGRRRGGQRDGHHPRSHPR